MREMGKNKNFAYCNNCEKEIFKPIRKSVDNMYYNVWILTIVSSLGFALIPFLIYHYVILKKDICPHCQNKVNFYNSREEIPEPKAEISRILRTIEQEKEEEKVYCPYCKQEIMKGVEICPSCDSNLIE